MRILYATDGSPEALTAATFLSRLSHHDDTLVHIMTVLDYEDSSDGADTLSTAQKALGSFAGKVTTSVKRASNNDAIVDIILLTAACEKSNMIVVGASGHTGIARFFLGGVAEAVVRHTTDPILVTRPSSGPLQTVIIGVDGSSNAHDAVCFATSQLPVPDNCTFRLVHVISPIWEGAGGPLLFGGPPQPVLVHAARTEKERAQRYVEALAYEAQRYVETLTDEIKGSRNPIEVQVRVGNPVEELLNAAHECNAGLIAVGSHGMSGMARLLLGSVSDHVVRHAPCSVLVVKRPPTGRIPTE